MAAKGLLDMLPEILVTIFHYLDHHDILALRELQICNALPSSLFQCRKSSLGVMRIRILDPHHSIFSLFLKLGIFSKKDCNMCDRDMNAKLRAICSTPILWRRVRFSRPVTLRTLWTCINLMKGITVQLSLKGLI